MAAPRMWDMMAVRVKIAEEQTTQGVGVKIKTVTGEQVLIVNPSEIVPNGSTLRVPKTFLDGAQFGHRQACPVCKGGGQLCPIGQDLWDRAEAAAKE